MKNSTIAKLAMRVSELYGSALDFAAKGGDTFGMAEGDGGCELPSVSFLPGVVEIGFICVTSSEADFFGAGLWVFGCD